MINFMNYNKIVHEVNQTGFLHKQTIWELDNFRLNIGTFLKSIKSSAEGNTEIDGILSIVAVPMYLCISLNIP